MISVAALAVFWLCLQAASASASSTLLSGYGGPGEGNQAILGSTLVGAGGSGSGGGGGSASSSSSSSSPSSIALVQVGAASSRAPGRHSAGSGHAKTHAAGDASKTASRAYTPASASSDRAGGGRTLGLTGDDVVYIVLAFGALALTALLTTRFASRAGGAGGTQ